ncbi:MAG: M23 family metallopeptidase [Oceanococcus sp.]
MTSVSVKNISVEGVSLSSRALLMGLVLVLCVVSAIAFAVGRASAPVLQASGLSMDHIRDVRPELDQQRERLAVSRREMAANQAAIARRLGKMQAEIVRLNAAGRKLTEIAHISEDEFSFDAEPAIGGPVQPGDELLAPSHQALDDLGMQLELKERQLDILEHLLMVSQLHSEQYPSGWPVKKGFISSLFGTRIDPFNGRRTRHGGVDFAAVLGTDIYTVAAGVVSFAGKRSGYGRVVEVNHGNGYVTRYAHNSRNLVRIGDRVIKGQPIALVGRSGRATGSHVHFEVLVDGQRINPHQYVSKK